MAGVALGDIRRRFTWQAWHLVTSTFGVASVLLMGLGWLWWRAWSPVTPRHFAWQAWQLVTSAVVSRGRVTSTFVLHGRHCSWRHPPSFCVAGLALIGTHTHTQLCHAHTHTHLCDTQLCHTHTSLSHTISHTQLCHTPSFTHIFVAHYLSHTTLSHTHTRNFVTHTHSSTHTHTNTTFPHATLSHTIFHTQPLHIQPFHSSIIHHLPCLSCLPRPAATLCSDHWKKGLSGPLIFSGFSWKGNCLWHPDNPLTSSSPQVDMLFTQRFYGRTWNGGFTLKSAAAKELVKYIFKARITSDLVMLKGWGVGGVQKCWTSMAWIS